MQSVNACRSAKQDRIIEDVRQILSVDFHKGQWIVRVAIGDSPEETVLRVGRAAVRITDPCFTAQMSAAETGA